MIAFIDYRTNEKEKKSLSSLNLDIIEVPKCPNVYDAINGHVDIQLNILDKKEKKIIINKSINESFKHKLNNLNIKYIESEKEVGFSYPNNVVLNALILENYFIHNLNYSDKNLISNQNYKELINVKQGYTKCSCLPINKNSLITSDIGIYKSLSKYGFDILLLPPGDIVLDGLNYGFIGGTGGLINDDTIAFFGNLNYYKYGDEVKSFLKKHKITPIYLNDTKLIDRGSLFVI